MVRKLQKLLTPRSSETRRAEGDSVMAIPTQTTLESALNSVSNWWTKIWRVIFPPAPIGYESRSPQLQEVKPISSFTKGFLPAPKPLFLETATSAPTPGRFEVLKRPSPSKSFEEPQPKVFKHRENWKKLPIWKKIRVKEPKIPEPPKNIYPTNQEAQTETKVEQPVKPLKESIQSPISIKPNFKSSSAEKAVQKELSSQEDEQEQPEPPKTEPSSPKESIKEESPEKPKFEENQETIEEEPEKPSFSEKLQDTPQFKKSPQEPMLYENPPNPFLSSTSEQPKPFFKFGEQSNIPISNTFGQNSAIEPFTNPKPNPFGQDNSFLQHPNSFSQQESNSFLQQETNSFSRPSNPFAQPSSFQGFGHQDSSMHQSNLIPTQAPFQANFTSQPQEVNYQPVIQSSNNPFPFNSSNTTGQLNPFNTEGSGAFNIGITERKFHKARRPINK